MKENPVLPTFGVAERGLLVNREICLATEAYQLTQLFVLFGGDLVGTDPTVVQNFVYQTGSGQLLIFLLNGAQGVQYHFDNFLLKVAVPLHAVKLFDALVQGGVGQSGVNGDQIGNAGLGIFVEPYLAITVGNGSVDLLLYGREGIQEENGAVGILGGLAHLLGGCLQILDSSTDLGNDGLGHLEYVAVEVVHTLCDIASRLDMLLLVCTDGYDVDVVEQNVRGHENRIGEQTATDTLGGLLCTLVLKLGHSVKLAHTGVALQDPCQLVVCGNLGLDEEGAVVGIQTAGQIQGRKATGPLTDQRGILLGNGDGVHIGNEQEGIVFLLEL